MQVQIQQPGVSGVDQSLLVTKHTQSFSNADSAGKVLREVAVDYVQREAGAGRDPIIAHICRKSTHGSVVLHSFYIALFSALEQTHCTHVACDSEWVTYPFIACIINIHGSGVLTDSALWLTEVKNDLDLMFLWDALLYRWQESINTTYHWLVKINWTQFWLMRHTHSDLTLTADSKTEVTDLGFSVVRLHNTNSHLFQRPFRHTINKQADERNTQRLQMGMQGWWGWDKTEECLGVKGRQLFVRVDCNLEEWEQVLLLQCFII